MASPESTKPAPKSPAVQDSPVFAYLSSLSPLKPVDSRPTVQPYGDTACPTPEAVFTSPHFCRPRELRSTKRLSGADKFSSATVIVPPMAQMVKLLPSGLKKCSDIGSSQDQHCSSPMTCVDAFLADHPDENYDELTGSPDHCLERAPTLAQNPQIDICSPNNNQIESQSEVVVQAGHISHAATGLPDLNLTQAAPVPHALRCDSSSTNGSNIKLQVPNNRPCNSSKFVLRSSSAHGAQEDPAHRGPSVDVNLAETESNLKMVDQVVEFNDASLDAQLLTVTKDHPSLVSNDNDAGIRREEPNNLSLRCHEKISRAETFQLKESECTPQLQPEFLQNIHSGVAHLDCTGEKSSASAKVHTFCDQEDGAQYQRCMRKRLQFEAVESCGMDTEPQTDSWIFTSDISNVEAPATSLDLKTTTAPNKDSFAVSGDKHLVQSVSRNSLCRFPCKTDSSVRKNESPSVSAPRSLGIGLHLNSIVGSTNITLNPQLPEDNLDAQAEKLLSVCNSQLAQHPTDSLASRSVSHSVKSSMSSDNFSPYNATENSAVKQQENQSIEAPHSSYPFAHSAKPLRSSLPSKPVDHYITPCSMKKRASEVSSRTESTQRSPNKKKHVKKAPDSEGCKRCNCKRSKCLKLYCDCFAAGVFCSDACSCQGCYNKPEHEETVHETRRQIESRNPLAFAPKVVVHAANPPKDTGDIERVTPTSARHKRGCNCKKSLCLKKYCECFQAGVGCSMGCRCDGCRNTFGRKCGGDESTEAESVKYKEIVGGRGPLKHLEAIEFKKGSVNNEICYSRLSPPTPLFQDTNENDIARSQLPAKYYPSPESGASVSPSYESPSSPMDSISSNTFAKETEGTSSLVPYNHGLGRHAAVQLDSLSPGWDGFPDICNFSPLPYPSPQASGAAAAVRVREPKTFHAKLFEGSGRLSVSSLLWRSSPVTPSQQLGENKSMIEPDSHSGLHQNHADDTPEILKDTSSPIKVVKASSPNQKRVSPPNKNVLEMRSSSSPSLKSSRKYILQSVPSFPPLTPYSKNTGKNDP